MVSVKKEKNKTKESTLSQKSFEGKQSEEFKKFMKAHFGEAQCLEHNKNQMKLDTFTSS